MNAKKCIHCGSFQDWRSSFGISTTVLSLLVALIAVATPLITTLNGIFSQPRAELSFSVESVDTGVLSLLVINGGDRPGVISQGVLRLPDGQSFVLQPASRGATMIGARESALVRYLVIGGPESFPNANRSCELSFMMTGQRSERQTYDFASQEVLCGYISYIFPGWLLDPETGEARNQPQ